MEQGPLIRRSSESNAMPRCFFAYPSGMGRGTGPRRHGAHARKHLASNRPLSCGPPDLQGGKRQVSHLERHGLAWYFPLPHALLRVAALGRKDSALLAVDHPAGVRLELVEQVRVLVLVVAGRHRHVVHQVDDAEAEFQLDGRCRRSRDELLGALTLSLALIDHLHRVGEGDLTSVRAAAPARRILDDSGQGEGQRLLLLEREAPHLRNAADICQRSKHALDFRQHAPVRVVEAELHDRVAPVAPSQGGGRFRRLADEAAAQAFAILETLRVAPLRAGCSHHPGIPSGGKRQRELGHVQEDAGVYRPSGGRLPGQIGGAPA
eukprot:scaffold2175_cov241-Pinguiococcus_pyrenoidosus.AAC.1